MSHVHSTPASVSAPRSRRRLLALVAPAAAAILALACGSPSSAKEGSPLVVVALAKVRPERVEDFKAAIALILSPTRAETGNLTFRFNQAEQDPTEFAFYEQWSTPAALDTHLKSSHMLAFFDKAKPMFIAGYPVIKTYREIGK